ncbi:hypothetical protein E4N80_03035 [Treponema denticola]|uniref:Uncharacterized protein n=1 Tax=Treponema denticola TaxID=158 RepID=A0A9Q9EWN7_TREDN|nr:hypothetical protein [Treponema denticola]UTC90903.1 hypothetical protein E4N87_09495 [Treponema denticola]UTC99745.1 hypothetical protein E4N86_03080 [Treponema denticola]UTD04524.1 hypothetical protein E4N80_03035 [Treponema denticola]
MKKVKLFIFLFLIIALNLSAFEGGGMLKTGLGIDLGKNKTNLSHFDSLSLWAKQNLDKEGNYNFAIQSSYLFNLKKPIKPDGKLDLDHIVNLDMLKFSFLFPIGNDSLTIDAGRYNISDITAVILNQNIDGVYIAYKKTNFATYFNLGYTGLLNAYVNPINAAGITSILKKQTKIYNLAPSFVHMSALFHVPFQSLRHAIDFDLNSFIATENPKTTNNYASISVNGPIVNGLFYLTSVSTSVLTRVKRKPGIGFFVSGELDYYFEKYSSKLGLKAQFFSGGKTGFKSFTLSNVSKVTFMEPTDLWKISLDGSIKPVNDLFLSTEAAVMAYAATQPKGRSNFAGFEWDVSANYTIRQDISISTDLGMFVGKNGKFDAAFKLKGIISF